MEWIRITLFSCIFIVQCNAMSQSEIEDFASFLQETSILDQNLKSNPESDYDEDEPISDHAWEESGKFEGDLILNDRQRRMIVTNVVEGLARNGLIDSTKRWPNNEVIYFIQREHFNLDQVQAIQNGIDDLGRASCVKFTPYKKGDRDAVVIQGSRRGCFSQVGYQGGYQVLNLSGRHPAGRGCFRHGTVVHELLHTLGFYHMQSSPDRDDYIDVLWENIIQAARHNFRKYNSFAVSDFGVGYDYESVLHYSQKAFSVNGRDTLVPKQTGVGIGQRVGLSQKDVQKLNKMYCDADSDLFLDSDSSKPPIVKKKSKNKPFQGRGIGYHQGNAVAIHLPAAQTHNLRDSLDIDAFNDFSTGKKTDVPPTHIQGFGIVKEVNNDMYTVPETMFQNNMDTMKVLSEENDKDNLQEILNRFSNAINNEMNPTDARKFDYDELHSKEYNIPRHITEPVHSIHQKSNNENVQNTWSELPSQTSNEDVNMYGTNYKVRVYENAKHASPYSRDQRLIDEMQHRYVDKNIAHRHSDAANDKTISKNFNARKIYNYSDRPESNDYLLNKPSSQINGEIGDISPHSKEHSSHLPYTTKWFNPASQQQPYQQFKLEFYEDNK